MGKTVIWRRDAGGWRMFELTNTDVFGADDPTGSRGSFWFTSLWAGGRDDAAVGGAIHALGRIPDAAFVYRYDGSGWTRQGISEGQVASLWGDGSGGLWISASGGTRTRRCSTTTARTSAACAGIRSVSIDGWPPGIDVSAMWGRRRINLLAAGAGSLAHWDGVEWKMAAAPRPRPPTATVIVGDAASTLDRAARPALLSPRSLIVKRPLSQDRGAPARASPERRRTGVRSRYDACENPAFVLGRNRARMRGGGGAPGPWQSYAAPGSRHQRAVGVRARRRLGGQGRFLLHFDGTSSSR